MLALLPSIIALFIAAFVAWIGYMQWRTAREKVALDLFDRRFQVFIDARLIVSFNCNAWGPVVDGGQTFHFEPSFPNEVLARGRFLFGDDIVDILKRLHGLCGEAETARNPTEAGAVSAKVDALLNEMLPKFESYMKMAAKP